MATRRTSDAKPRGKLTALQVGLEHGFRSGLEETIGASLAAAGVPFTYESFKVPFVQPAKKRTYCPDFALPNGVVIESKGRFLAADRSKHLWVKAQYPDLDLRFVFSSSKARITKASPTSYADWCVKHGFLYSDKAIPKKWIDEPPNPARIEAVRTMRHK